MQRRQKAANSLPVLRSEIPSGMCAKPRTVAASSNRNHLTRSLYYCLFAPRMYVCCSGSSPARGQWCPPPPFEIGSPQFHVWPPGCYIHPILYFKNVAPLLVFGPSFGLWLPMLLNPGDGPGVVLHTHPVRGESHI